MLLTSLLLSTLASAAHINPAEIGEIPSRCASQCTTWKDMIAACGGEMEKVDRSTCGPWCTPTNLSNMDTCNSCVQHAPDLGVREDIKWAADDVHSMCLALDKEGAGTASTATGSNGADSARTDSAAGTGGAATATGDATGTDAGTGAAMAGNGPATTGAATFPTAGDAGMSTTASAKPNGASNFNVPAGLTVVALVAAML